AELLDYLPAHNFITQESNFQQDLETTVEDLALDTIVPDSANQPYDMLEVIATIVDDGALLQVQERYAPNIIVGLRRVEGRTVGVVANQPQQLAGTLDIAASEKAARLVRFCDAFNIPMVTLVDVPGFLPGVDQEHSGIIRRGSTLFSAYAAATVPAITVISRRAFGAGEHTTAS